jgi:hypothetical protein
LSEEITLTVKVPEAFLKLVPKTKLVEALTIGVQLYLNQAEELYLGLRAGTFTQAEAMDYCIKLGIEASKEGGEDES